MTEKFITEIRTRLLRFLSVFFLVFAVSCYFSSSLLTSLILWSKHSVGLDIISTALVSPIYLKIKLAMYMALLICFLHFIFECWQFLAPALHANEVAIAKSILLVFILAFYLGFFASYFFIFKLAVIFFLTSGITDLKILLDLSNLLDLCFYITMICQLLVLLPLLLGILIRFDIVSLSAAKQLRSKVIIACFIIGMLLTPPDVISQICVALPLWLSFELVIFIAGHTRLLSKPSFIK